MYNMSRLHVTVPVRKVGNSLGILLPAAEARKAGLQEGEMVDALLETKVSEPLGLLKDLPYREFRRSKEGLWRERI